MGYSKWSKQGESPSSNSQTQSNYPDNYPTIECRGYLNELAEKEKSTPQYKFHTAQLPSALVQKLEAATAKAEAYLQKKEGHADPDRINYAFEGVAVVADGVLTSGHDATVQVMTPRGGNVDEKFVSSAASTRAHTATGSR